MYAIQISVHCPLTDHAEILHTDLDGTARLIEERLSMLLLELFAMVYVDDVTVTCVPINQSGDALSAAA